MRKYLFYGMCMLMSFSSFAQLADGSFAPDFTLQDIHGNTWHLYELLDQGKNVIIDFSATWCYPCWDYHESGALNEVYANYGPDGTDEFMVFLIEGDPETNLDCLYGLPDCHNSIGDWTAGTLYPIINDDFIAWEYKITYWPTLFQICPNKLVRELFLPHAEEIYDLKDECAVALGDNNASAVEYVSFSGTFCGSITIDPTIKVQNLGHDPMVSATAECYVNDVLQQTVLWTGHVIPYATFLLSFDSMTITENASIMVRITSVNDAADDDVSNNTIEAQLNLHPAKAQNILQLELTTYIIPTEVYWELANSDSIVLYKGGNPLVVGKADDGGTYTTSDTTYIIPIPLPGDGCYRFSIYDHIGYGAAVSHYKITDAAGEVLAEGADFPSSEHHLIGIDNAVNPIPNNGGISRIDGWPDVFCSHTEYALSLELINQGTATITQAEIELLENGQLLQLIEWTGNIQPGAIENISVPPTFFSTGKNILFRIKSINGAADTFEYQNEREANLERHLSEDHTITLEMQLDYWAYEIYWQLTNSAGEVVYSGGNTKVGPYGGGSVETQPDDPGAYDHEQLVVVNMDLPDTIDDCYDFLLVDGNGDGIIFGGYVRFSETHSGKEVVYKDYSLIEFVTTTIPLEVNPIKTSTETLADVNDIFLYPNPAQSEVQVQFETKKSLPVALSVINMLGENVLQLPEKNYSRGISNISLDVRVLPCGIYYLQLVSGNQQMTRKLAVIR